MGASVGLSPRVREPTAHGAGLLIVRRKSDQSSWVVVGRTGWTSRIEITGAQLHSIRSQFAAWDE